MLLQVLVTNKVLAMDVVGGVEGGNELIEEYEKSSKIEKLSKGLNCLSPKNQLSQIKNYQKVRIYLILMLKSLNQAF